MSSVWGVVGGGGVGGWSHCDESHASPRASPVRSREVGGKTPSATDRVTYPRFSAHSKENNHGFCLAESHESSETKARWWELKPEAEHKKKTKKKNWNFRFCLAAIPAGDTEKPRLSYLFHLCFQSWALSFFIQREGFFVLFCVSVSEYYFEVEGGENKCLKPAVDNEALMHRSRCSASSGRTEPINGPLCV